MHVRNTMNLSALRKKDRLKFENKEAVSLKERKYVNFVVCLTSVLCDAKLRTRKRQRHGKSISIKP
jgi:hypothetical protein